MEDEEGDVINYKARWVVKRYMKAQGVDYDLNNDPVSRISTLMVHFSLAVKLKLKVNQKDLRKSFLYDDLDEFIYL